MAPKLHTLITLIFKGRAYELEYLANGFYMKNQQANLLKFLGVFFQKQKNCYVPEICKNSKTTQLKMHPKHNRLLHFRKISHSVSEKPPSFFCFTCSSDIPLQITRGLMA